MTSQQIQQEIAEVNGTLAGLERSRSAAGKRIADLQAERKAHLLPARTAKNKASQASLGSLSAEIEKLVADQRDDTEILAEVSGKLQSLNAQLAAAQKQEHLGRVCSLVKLRAKGEPEQLVAEAAAKLRAALEAMVQRDQEVVEALRGFDPKGLDRAAQHVGRHSRLVMDSIAYSLRDLMPTPFLGEYNVVLANLDLSGIAPEKFGDVLRVLEER